MKTVKLYGAMRKQFGHKFVLDVANPAEAIRALCVIRPGFRAYLETNKDRPFRVLVGGEARDLDGLGQPSGASEVIKLVPVVGGAKDGFDQILVGAALMVASYYIPGAWTLGSMSVSGAVASMGVAMMLGGVAQTLARTQQVDPGNGNSGIQTWTFGSPTLTVGQGNPVPLCYGRMRIGGHVISAGVAAETWQDKGFGALASDNLGTLSGNGDTVPWVAAIAPV